MRSPILDRLYSINRLGIDRYLWRDRAIAGAGLSVCISDSITKYLLPTLLTLLFLYIFFVILTTQY